MRRAYRLGLTGGIGSGKSTVARLLEAQGAVIIDADALSRSLTAAGGLAIAPIAAEFGAQAIAPDGALDRGQMRDLVFADPQARQRLEAIIHPLVRQLTEQRVQQAEAEAEGARLLVFDVPLLVESGHWRERYDGVLVIDCSEATQVQRVMARSQLTAETVRSIIANQASREERRAAADWVILNDGLDFSALESQVRAIAASLRL